MREQGAAEIRHPNGAPAAITKDAAAALAVETPDCVPLDEHVIALVAQYAAQAAAIEGAKQGALALFMRQKGLSGTWGISDNGRELERRG